jgi:hypothetical protein
MIYDAAVIIPTVLRPKLRRAVRSVFAQDFKGKVQVLLGIDVAKGERAILDELRRDCPPRMKLEVLDLGYSTSKRNGGFYPIWGGGGLRTILSYAANSRYLTYLDDDNWWAPRHLSSLRRAINGFDWAFSFRWYVDPDTQQPLCVDRWESLGPGRGMYAKAYNGLVDTSCFMIDKDRCHWALPAWCVPHPHSKLTERRGGAEDRSMFDLLHRKFKSRATGLASVYYVMVKGSGPYSAVLKERDKFGGTFPEKYLQPVPVRRRRKK